MISLKQILNESLSLYECEVLVKTSKNINKIEIYNRIRALTGVVVLKVEQNNYLQQKANDVNEYSLLHVKYIVGKEPVQDINLIRADAMGHSKIPGLLQFLPRYKTIRKKGSY